MLDDKLMPKGTNEQDKQLVHHLRYLYDKKAENAQSLTRIHERLLSASKEALPVVDAPDLADVTQQRRTPARRGKEHPMHSLHIPWNTTTNIWSHRLGQLVAVLLVAIITGTFAIVLTLSHLSVGGAPATFQTRPGWQEVTVYRGKGNATLTHLNLSLPQLWATSVTCNGDGAVNMELSGGNYSALTGTDDCQIPSLPQPTGFTYSAHATTSVIQTMKVTAKATTSWQLHFLQAVKQPTFQLGTEWKPGGAGASIDGISFTKSSDHSSWQRETTRPGSIQISGMGNTTARTWGIVTVCFGTGKSHATLTPDVGNIALPACNGQPVLTTIQFPVSTSVQTLTFYVTGDMVSSISMVACTDEARCQQQPALQVIPTPVSSAPAH